MKGIASWHLWARLAGWVGGETSIEEEAHNLIPLIAPNPASDYIEINYSVETGLRPVSTGEIKIYNILGECVINVETQNAVSLQRIDISHLPVGVYYIQIGNYRKKFMLIR